MELRHYKTLRRWLAAAIASTVIMMIGPREYIAVADEGCGLSDVADWREALDNPAEEATPAYRQSVSEAFLEACPNRPEGRDARLLAGFAAVEAGDAFAAADHLSVANTPARGLPTREALGLMAALAELGEADAAWVLRTQMIEAWLTALERTGNAEITSEVLRGGVMHQAVFSTIETEDRTRAVWVAVPDGPGWSSAIVLRSDAFRASLHRLRAGAGSARLEHLDLVGCSERITLTQAEGVIPVEEVRPAAIAALKLYLSQPELPAKAEPGEMLNTCIWPDLMLPVPRLIEQAFTQ